MREPALRLMLPDAGATEALGGTLAAALPDLSNTSLVLHLRGDLGVGKTTFTRGFLRRLGVTGVVRSPTYTLVEPYALAQFSCIHVDLYRLRGPDDLEDLGLRDYTAPRHVLVIEWPEKGGRGLPAADLVIGLDYAPSGRAAEIIPCSAAGRTLASHVA
jgi:tRNA threonylcarbamoyladenosine biosynthesis protein TsaE